MNTALISLALAGILTAPSWQISYPDAQQRAAAQRKPIAVVFAPGPFAWTKVIRDQGPAPEVSKLLTAQYVCVFVDTDTPEGKQMARNFEISADRGLILSNREGSLQAFWHQGDLPNDAMMRYLHKYADPTIVVTGTETVTPPRANNYQPAPVRTVNC